MEKIVKIDVDGVLRDIISTMCEIYNEEFSTNLKYNDIKEYDVSLSFPLIEKKYNFKASYYFFVLHGKKIFRDSPKYPEVNNAILKLHNLGYRIIIVSSQESVENKIDTLKWLHYNEIYYDDICFTKNKDIVKGDYMVDDYPNNLREITGSTQPILILQPYNKMCKEFKKFSCFISFVESLA